MRAGPNKPPTVPNDKTAKSDIPKLINDISFNYYAKSGHEFD